MLLCRLLTEVQSANRAGVLARATADAPAGASSARPAMHETLQRQAAGPELPRNVDRTEKVRRLWAMARAQLSELTRAALTKWASGRSELFGYGPQFRDPMLFKMQGGSNNSVPELEASINKAAELLETSFPLPRHGRAGRPPKPQLGYAPVSSGSSITARL
jgi:hypothetical protein